MGLARRLQRIADAAPNPIPPLPHVFHIHVNPFQMVRTGPTFRSPPIRFICGLPGPPSTKPGSLSG